MLDKRMIKVDLPVTVAFFVYRYAKLRMLEFVYKFLKKYLKDGSYQIICSDTDSVIAAYEDRNIDNLIKEGRKKQYYSEGKPGVIATDAYSNRTPGLFKIEMSATSIVALCSKTYIAINADDGTKKVNSKFLSKAHKRSRAG